MKSPVRSNSGLAGRTQNFGPSIFWRAALLLRGRESDLAAVAFTGDRLDGNGQEGKAIDKPDQDFGHCAAW
jgi:hypothetical protein